MATVFDVDANELISRLKDELKKIEQIKSPEWVNFTKSSSGKTKPPEQDDFWHIRAAAILRQTYIQEKPIGVQRLRVKYGDKTKKGRKPSHFRRSSGKIIRNISQQLESAGLIKKTVVGGKKGRTITKKGKSIVDKLSSEIIKGTKNE